MSTTLNVTGIAPQPIIINGIGTVQQITATGVVTQQGPKGIDGRNPLTVSASAPSSPQIGDLWYQP